MSKKDIRKAGRRAAQLEKMEEKSRAEAEFFWDQVKRAKRDGRERTHGRAEELFGKQLTAGINFAQYAHIPVSRTCGAQVKACEQIACLDNFGGLSQRLPPFLYENVQRMGYSVPTPIQKHAVPLALDGRADLMCCAQTGSGKTCAFLLPAIALIATQGSGGRLHGNRGKGNGKSGASAPQNTLFDELPPLGPGETPARPRVLVLAPTRELAIQIQVEAMKLTFGSPFFASVVYGGAPARGQLQELAMGADVLVATPGRLTDFLERGLVSLKHCAVLVLDEADRMLDMGFEPQLRRIVERSNLPSNAGGLLGRRTMMFSATFPEAIQRLAGAYLRPYAYVAVGRVGSTTASIEQRLVLAPTHSKQAKFTLLVEALKTPLTSASSSSSGGGKGGRKGGAAAAAPAADAASSALVHDASATPLVPLGRTIVFVQKKHVASWVKGQLRRTLGVAAEDIHGDRSQSQRESALQKFKDGSVNVLVATDVAARGLDVPQVNHVVNFDLPCSKEDFDSYVHRIGRTGRAGNTGLATSFFVPGFDPKTGNGALWTPLHALLKENGQVLPPWFMNLGGARGGGGGGGGGGGSSSSSSSAVQVQQPQRDARGGHGGGARGGGKGGKGKMPGGNVSGAGRAAADVAPPFPPQPAPTPPPPPPHQPPQQQQQQQQQQAQANRKKQKPVQQQQGQSQQQQPQVQQPPQQQQQAQANRKKQKPVQQQQGQSQQQQQKQKGPADSNRAKGAQQHGNGVQASGCGTLDGSTMLDAASLEHNLLAAALPIQPPEPQHGAQNPTKSSRKSRKSR